MTNSLNLSAEPSRPGQRKSNSDQRSDSRFSTGVPVRAIRASAWSCLTALRLPRGRILDGLGLVEHHQPPVHLEQPLLPQQHAVGGQDQVGVCKGLVRIFRPCRQALPWPSPTDGRNRASSVGAKRAISAFQLRQQRRRQHQQRRLFGRPLLLHRRQQRQHLDRLAQAHVVGQAGAQPQA